MQTLPSSLCHHFDQEDSGYYREAGKVVSKQLFIRGHGLDGVNPAPGLQSYDSVEENETHGALLEQLSMLSEYLKNIVDALH